jgi:hypothetical protein
VAIEKISQEKVTKETAMAPNDVIHSWDSTTL